jgi:pilus assembly protein Flp/PilA
MTMFARLHTIVVSRFACFLARENGATAIEYGLIAAGIAVVIAATVFGLGSQVNSMLYGNIAAALQ